MAAAWVTCSLMVGAGPASAQASRKTQATAAAPLPQTSGPLIAVVSIGAQRVTVYDRNGVVAQSPISSGQPGHETPHGVFSIIEKKEEHYSNLYNDASMPFMQRITWSGVALHAGALPGYPASHGCIRLPHSFAQRLFGMTRMNMRVIVVPGETAPMSIAHPSLLQPRVAAAAETAAPATSQAEPATRPAPVFKSDDAGAAPEAPMMLGGRLPKPTLPEGAETAFKAEKAIISPLEAARAQKAAAALKATATTKAADAARLAHKAKLAEVVRAQRGVGPADYAARQADQKAKYLERLIAQAKTDEQKAKATEAHAAALAAATAAAQAASEAKSAYALRQAEVKTTSEAIKTAEKERVAAAAEARAAERLVDPISVFVSRKTSRLYIRQGRQPVADFPVTIKDRDQPIGTHVFTATAPIDGGAGVAWSVVSLQGTAAAAAEAQLPIQRQQQQAQSKSKKGQQAQPARPTTAPASELGAQAIERIEFPPAALDRITPYMHPGSSLIISDLGLSVETGQGTDFVVQTRGEEDSIKSQIKWAEERGLRVASRRN